MAAKPRGPWTAAVLVVLLAAPPAASAGSAPENPPTIGYVDRGINPYHEDFRAPGWTAHPSTYLEGYPEDAEALDLTLDAGTFEEAWAADRDEWASVDPGQLYYVPGTRIVGAIAQEPEDRGLTPIYDDEGHGTLVASVGSGASLGTAPDSAIVATEGGTAASLEWIRGQPWIDVTSISQRRFVGVPGQGAAAASHAVVQEGRAMFNGGGNGPGTNLLGDLEGPPWVVQVGAGDPTAPGAVPGSRVCPLCDRPVEVLGRVGVPAARTDSTDGRREAHGTSTATPRVAGYAARLIEAAREGLDDVSHPPTSPASAYAQATGDASLPDRGPLADGAFDRAELESLVRQSAIPVSWAMPNTEPIPLVPDVLPSSDQRQPAQARYTWQGYGLLNASAFERARSILLGEQPWPERPVDDRWHAFWEGARAAYWHTALCPDQAHRQRYEGSCWTDPAAGFARAGVGVAEGAGG